MEVSGKMKWDCTEGMLMYHTYWNNISSLLGISDLTGITLVPEIAPYETYILGYISKMLIIKSSEGGTKLDLIKTIEEIFETGGTDIISGNAEDLAIKIGISTEPDPSEPIIYCQDRFIYTWTGVLTSLMVRLEFQYYSLIHAPSSPFTDCMGQTVENLELWTSGVYGEDTEHLGFSYDRKEKDTECKEKPICQECTKSYREEKEIINKKPNETNR